MLNSLCQSARRIILPWLLVPVTIAGCWSYISTEAHSRFQSRTGPLSVTVYPVNVAKGGTLVHDRDLSQRLAAWLRQEQLAAPVIATTAANIPVQWRANQAKMAQTSANAFAATVKNDAIQTDYALLVDILCNPDESRVIGVHYYLSDRNGQLADGGLTNSHWDEFKQVQPTDRQGGYEVLLRMLRRSWKRE